MAVERDHAHVDWTESELKVEDLAVEHPADCSTAAKNPRFPIAHVAASRRVEPNAEAGNGRFFRVLQKILANNMPHDSIIAIVQGTVSKPLATGVSAMPSGRVTLRRENVGGVGSSEFTVDILTHGRAAPLVTLGDNAGFPRVQDFYARAKRVDGGIGQFDVVRLTIRFTGSIPSSASAIAVNVFQEDATDFIYPWFSLIDRLEESDKALAGNPAPS